ncbi:Phospholipid methyltransferase [Cognatiyoonia koreensis]|uniref:Phospholipid methyltransferase n=1 Tax=Cognatiyoonia koreensis TaxID=364200 RepID=A0A1I0NIG7_9RHOB|nr:isoprenylcysteine carboxylmethyltransferase family protein [Cognatiyoonia koreensis]SEW01087.1 Phospholipid methyltransferase [Cognatiyoonia koreensis]
MKWIDLPPVWLALFALLTYWIGTMDLLTERPGFEFLGIWVGPNRIGWGGELLIAAGLFTMSAAIVELVRNRTTVIPHQDADTLVQSGIFAFSRNPIYVGDTLVLAGLAIIWGAPLALFLVPLFVWIIRQRFVLPEEQRLHAKFGQAFDDYCDMTRRWI